DMNGISAAHKTLPFGTIVQVVDLETGKSVIVRINDRGPFIKGRIIDLSKGAAEKLGIIDKGITKVGLRILRWPKKE
ncbi:MAG: septal ring lytic transglycosylase RlpA family protein, partial [Thermoplasmata archaeon]